MMNKLKSSAESYLAFVKEIFKHPTAVGAAFPSSKQLTRALIADINPTLSGYVVDLGAGTGAVTNALIAKGFPEEKIILIEQAKDFIELLKHQFVKSQVINGDAEKLSELLLPYENNISVIISSLPLKLFSQQDIQILLSQARQVLSDQGLFVQFTYDLLHPIKLADDYFDHQSNKVVWRNLPPARVDVYRKK